MSFDYLQTAQEAHDTLIEFGGAEPGVRVRMVTSATYDRENSKATPSGVAEFHGVGLVFEYALKDSGNTVEQGSLIRAGDKQLYLSPLDVEGVAIPVPLDGGKCVAPDGITYTMKNIKPLAPSGIACLYEITLRR